MFKKTSVEMNIILKIDHYMQKYNNLSPNLYNTNKHLHY